MPFSLQSQSHCYAVTPPRLDRVASFLCLILPDTATPSELLKPFDFVFGGIGFALVVFVLRTRVTNCTEMEELSKHEHNFLDAFENYLVDTAVRRARRRESRLSLPANNNQTKTDD